VSPALGVALPFWLDRPDDEAVAIAIGISSVATLTGRSVDVA
jgi:hypothetical protein